MNYKHRSMTPRQVEPGGLLRGRLRLSLDRLLGERGLHTAYAGWGADQIGRWIGATVLEALLVTDSAALPIIQEKADELRVAQDADGFYYGAELRSTPERIRECWFGHGRGIWNLLEYYYAVGDEAALASVMRAADYAVATRNTWEISRPLCGGIESTVGPMARLGNLTRRPEYIEYARYMADNIDHRVASPSPVPTAHVDSTSLHTHEEKPYFHHTHSYLNTLHGIVDLAVVTGEQKYVDQAKRAFEDSFSSVWLSGAFPESYGDYYERIDETCSTVDWMMLALKLFALTGESRYLDSAELSALNQLAFGQATSGTFTCYRSINRRHWADERNRGCAQNECCAMSGGWGLAQAAMHTITETEEGVSVNLPIDVRATFERNGDKIGVAQRLAVGSHALGQSIHVRNGSSNALAVQIRVPYWCDAPIFRVGGSEHFIRAESGWLKVTCPANAERSIELHLPMSLRIIPARRNALVQPDREASGSATEPGVQFGPYVLLFNREMYPEITERDIRVTLELSGEGRPRVRQDYPDGWPVQHGAVPLFVEANIHNGVPALLTPCANMTMTPITVDDPYILRFAAIDTE